MCDMAISSATRGRRSVVVQNGWGLSCQNRSVVRAYARSLRLCNSWLTALSETGCILPLGIAVRAKETAFSELRLGR